MTDSNIRRWLIGIEAFLCAFFVGIIQTSWGWFFGVLIGTAVLLIIPLVGGAIGIFISLIISCGVASFFSNPVASWYIGIILFIILSYLHSTFSSSGHILFGFSIVICEAFVLAGTINMKTNTTILPVAVFIVLVIMSIVPLLRLFEYIILSLITVIEVYVTAAEYIDAPHTFIVSFLILTMLLYYFLLVYVLIDYNGMIKSGKKAKIIKKVNEIYPMLENGGSEFEHILNRCNGEEERHSFLMDWENYKLSLWEERKNKEKVPAQKPPFSFEDWYKANDRWRDTSYFHSYYEKQINEEEYTRNEVERIRKLWVCEYCGRINSKNNYQCKACGAMQKLVIPEEKL